MTYTPEFFSTASGVIPTVLLALIVEDRLQPRRAGKKQKPDEGLAAELERVWRTFALAGLVFGEALALRSVATGSASHQVGAAVALSLVPAALMLFEPVLDRAIDRGASRREAIGHGVVGLVFIVGLLIAWMQISL